MSEDDGTRTCNHRIDSLNTSSYNHQIGNHFRPRQLRGCPLVAQASPPCHRTWLAWPLSGPGCPSTSGRPSWCWRTAAH